MRTYCHGCNKTLIQQCCNPPFRIAVLSTKASFPFMNETLDVTLDAKYGSDQHGLVWAYLFEPQHAARVVHSKDIISLLDNEDFKRSDKFLWLHFSLSNSHSRNWLKKHLNLPLSFYESLSTEIGATRMEQEAGALVAVVHDVLFDLVFDTSQIAVGTLYIDSKLAVSARLRPMRSLEQLRAEVRSGIAFRSPVDLLAHLLRDQANVLTGILRKSTLRVDKIEDQLLANRVSFSRTDLGSLRRVLVRLQRLLAPEPAAFFRMLNRPPEWISKEDLRELQQAAEEFSAVVGDSVALIERVKLLQEELAAQVNEQTNRTLYVLTLVTVLALPVNLVAGLFGMNVGGIPFTQGAYGFFLIVSLLILLTIFLARFALGKRRD